MQAKRPKLKFPESFQMSITTNDYALNLTELLYYDKQAERIRIQFFYSLLGLEATKGFDLVLDQKKKLVAVQSETDCKYTSFHNTLMPVSLFFTMFNTLTEYRGIEEGLHKFKVRQIDETATMSPRLYFFFDDENNFKRAAIE